MAQIFQFRSFFGRLTVIGELLRIIINKKNVLGQFYFGIIKLMKEKTPNLLDKVEWSKVTVLSKILAMTLFIVLPFIGFYLGMEYGGTKLKILETKSGS